MEDSKKLSNSDNSQYFFQKFHGLVLGFVGLIECSSSGEDVLVNAVVIQRN